MVVLLVLAAHPCSSGRGRLPLDVNHLSMLSVSVFFICLCCLVPEDPISIFLIPGDYIVMLGCRIGTKLKRAFRLPILTCISHHITLCWPVLLLSPQSLPRAPTSSISQCPLSRLWSDSTSFRPWLPYCPCLWWLRRLGHCCTKPLCDRALLPSWWSGLTVVVVTPAFLFGHMHT